jgi:hypothetical protein
MMQFFVLRQVLMRYGDLFSLPLFSLNMGYLFTMLLTQHFIDDKKLCTPLTLFACFANNKRSIQMGTLRRIIAELDDKGLIKFSRTKYSTLHYNSNLSITQYGRQILRDIDKEVSSTPVKIGKTKKTLLSPGKPAQPGKQAKKP